MGVISFKHRGSFDKTENFLLGASKKDRFISILERYGQIGVTALAEVTPVDSGITANSWDYDIKVRKDSFSITWTNNNRAGGVPLVILLHYGHGTRGGTYVEGRDFINPAIKPIFDEMTTEIWQEVTRL